MEKDEGDLNVMNSKLVEFNQGRTLVAFTKMIIINEHPFKFIENEGFSKFIQKVQPYFKIPSHVTIACLYLMMKRRI